LGSCPYLALLIAYPGNSGVSNATAEWLGLAALVAPPLVLFVCGLSFGWWRWRPALAYAASCLCALAATVGLSQHSGAELVWLLTWGPLGLLVSWSLARGIRLLTGADCDQRRNVGP